MIGLSVINNKGFYDDIPVMPVFTTTRNGLAYGNFVFDGDRQFSKVTCIIKGKQLTRLGENKKYFIRFKIHRFVDGVKFDNEFSKIELPAVTSIALFCRCILMDDSLWSLSFRRFRKCFSILSI